MVYLRSIAVSKKLSNFLFRFVKSQKFKKAFLTHIGIHLRTIKNDFIEFSLVGIYLRNIKNDFIEFSLVG